MSVYKIFPEKSATIYSFYPFLNSGLDEILEISTFYSTSGSNEVSRALLKFPTSEINRVLTTVSASNYDAYLKLSLANASQIPLNYDLFCYPLAIDWDKGVGRSGDYPQITDGVSWVNSDRSGSIAWTTGSFPSGTTGSFSSTIGGGVWLTGSNYTSTQSFSFTSNKDIELKVTNVVTSWNNSSINNYGLILKHSSSLEFTSASKFELKYFSDNTHTIYPPCLEVRWDDSTYTTGSLTLVNNNSFVVSLGNNKGEYQQGSIQRFNVNARDKYPARVFQTSSLYTTNKALPSSSYWSIKDLDTEEIIVDYDTNYTKLSCDGINNYFNIYMNGLEPERFYKIILKVVLGNGETIVSDLNYFKVVK